MLVFHSFLPSVPSSTTKPTHYPQPISSSNSFNEPFPIPTQQRTRKKKKNQASQFMTRDSVLDIMQRLNSSSRPGFFMSELCGEKDPGNSTQEHEGAPTIVISEKTESKSTQWTDEKHGLYLNSMEASFVNQLYDSMNTLGGCSSEPLNSRQMQNVISNPEQYKVCKDGSWARVNFRNFRGETPRTKRVEKSGHILANPWIQHYRSLGAHQSRISSSLQEQALPSTVVDSSAAQFGCQGDIGSAAEVTDQNFVDEVPEEEKPTKIHRQKCRKISAASGLSKDQVVPFAHLSLIGNNIVKINGSPNE